MTDDKQINVRVPRWLHKEAKIKSVQEGRSLQEVLSELIEKWVKEQQTQQPQSR